MSSGCESDELVLRSGSMLQTEFELKFAVAIAAADVADELQAWNKKVLLALALVFVEP